MVEKIVKILTLFAVLCCGMGANFVSVSTPIGEITPFRAALFLALLTIILFKIRKVRICYKENRFPIFVMIVWVMVAFISLFWSKDVNSWGRALFFLLINIGIIILFINVIKVKEDILKVLWFYNIGVFIQAFIGLYETITCNYLFFEMNDANYKLYVVRQIRSPLAMFGNTNNFATYMFFGALAAAICALVVKNIFCKIFNIGCIALYFYLVVMSGSRAVLIGLIISAIVILVLFGYKAWGLCLIAVLIFLFVLCSKEKILEKLSFDFETKNSSEGIRINLIKNGFIFLGDTYGLGLGAGQIETHMAESSAFYVKNITNMHNWWMEILTAYGLPFFVLYCINYVYMIFKYIKGIFFTKVCFNKYFSLVMVGMLFGYIIASMSASSNISSEFMWVFFAIAIVGLHFIRDRCLSR